MSIPNISDPRWHDLVTGKKDPPLTALATKLLLQRLRQTVRHDASATPKAIAELHSFFAANAFAQRDISVL